MGRFVSTTKISSPIAVAAQPDVDLNGMMFSYVIGLMFPPQAAIQMTSVVRAPYPATTNQSTGQISRASQ